MWLFSVQKPNEFISWTKLTQNLKLMVKIESIESVGTKMTQTAKYKDYWYNLSKIETKEKSK